MNEADKNFGSGLYCSRGCSNSRVRTDEVKQKISLGVKKVGKLRNPLNEASLEKWRNSVRQSYETKYLSKSFDELYIGQKRRRVIEEQCGRCADCGLSEWKGQPIKLEMDHKDGNTNNNVRENLWALCPNCHSMTETWRGKNKPRYNGEKKVSDAELLAALRSEPNIRRALLSVGLSAKAGNYARAKSLDP